MGGGVEDEHDVGDAGEGEWDERAVDDGDEEEADEAEVEEEVHEAVVGLCCGETEAEDSRER